MSERFEWRMYDRGTLFWIRPSHSDMERMGWGGRDYCPHCHEIRYLPGDDFECLYREECETDVTDVYRNLIRNLATVVALAASAQRGRGDAL